MKFISSKNSENIKVALRSIRSQPLRTFITVLMIVLGIMALVAFNTAATAMERKVTAEFSAMGSNTFVIKSGRGGFFGGNQGVRRKQYKPINYDQARRFSKEFPGDALVSVSAFASGQSVIKYETKKTNPNVQVVGGDASYLDLSGYELASGRNFSETDIRLGNNVVLVGADVVKKLFGSDAPQGAQETPVSVEGMVVSVGSYKYTIIGTLKAKGASLGFSQDNQCLIPISNLKKKFGTVNTQYTINVRVDNTKDLDSSIDESYGLMGVIRGDDFGGESSFRISKSDAMAEEVNDLLGGIGVAMTFIGYITLLGAAIGLMNIMLVSVTERTREIGVRKAIGASSRMVLRQFLTEAIVIGQIGGLAGTVLGVLAGNLISIWLETPFTIPWTWIVIGVVSCFIMSVVSGFFPARKAARLEPIESLRYE